LIKISVIGNSQSGKTSVCGFMKEFLEEAGYTNIVTLKFADALKEYTEYLGVDKNRGFLQDISDATKKYYGDDVFINTLKAADAICCEAEADGQSQYNVDAILNDDCRYITELEVVNELGYLTIYVDAPMDCRVKRSIENNVGINDSHSSESEVTFLRGRCDYYINNNKDMLSLKAQCEGVFNGIIALQKGTLPHGDI